AADTIVVLDAGRVRATGTHAQLVQADAWYAAFARAGQLPDGLAPAEADAEARPAESEH
ncbi:ABC transporter ATP-binding protein, partial [Burkholderia sp. HAN2018]|nr:ABC transporter ATP-binding protein [Burkholderia sp. HAN2018]